MIDEGIKKDFGSAAIIDYSGNNREQLIVFTCEHSSNKYTSSH